MENLSLSTVFNGQIYFVPSVPVPEVYSDVSKFMVWDRQ